MSSVVVVTGGSRGIGYETARYMASQGWDIALCSRGHDEALQAAKQIESDFGVRAIGAMADVADASQMNQFALDVDLVFDQVKVLICNAAIIGPIGELVDVQIETLMETFNVNVCGFVNSYKAFWRSLQRNRGFRIVSLAGGGLGGPGQMARAPGYVPSKSALVTMSETVSDEVVEAGGTINVVAPGNIPTSFMKSAIEAGQSVAGEMLYSQALAREGLEIGDSLTRFFRLLDFIVSEKSNHLSGRFLSARWDDPQSLLTMNQQQLSANIFKLRRIDDDLFTESES